MTGPLTRTAVAGSSGIPTGTILLLIYFMFSRLFLNFLVPGILITSLLHTLLRRIRR